MAGHVGYAAKGGNSSSSAASKGRPCTLTLRRAFRKRIAGRPLWDLARKSRSGSELGGLRPRAQNGMTFLSFPHGDVRSVHCFGASSAQYTNTLNPDHASILLDQPRRRAAPIGASEATKKLPAWCIGTAWLGLILSHCHGEGGFFLCHSIRRSGCGPRHVSGHLTASVQRPHPF